MILKLLIEEIKKRIETIENDKFCDNQKKQIIIKENNRILKRLNQFEIR